MFPEVTVRGHTGTKNELQIETFQRQVLEDGGRFGVYIMAYKPVSDSEYE